MFKKKKVLITGVAGFIGFSLAKKLCEDGFLIKGIDNYDPYYSVQLKKKRIEYLKKFKNFHFKKIDITKKKLVENYFNENEFDQVIHLAAQAGVRYSLTNPDKYIDVNFLGFINIIDNVINKKIDKFIFASSSSVYGEQKKYPVKESYKLNPKNIYAQTKVLNENISYDLNQKNNTKIIGLRFFTVYGEWGRPDMFIMKYLNAIYLKKKINIFNRGNHYRDFTYIDDVTSMVKKIIIKRTQKKYQIFNICSNRPIYLKKLISMINKMTPKKPLVAMTKFQKADVLKTHGDNKKIKKYINYKKFTNINLGLKKTIEWFNKEKAWKY